MTCFFIFIIRFGITGALWRAVFVAAVALIAFTLARYWKHLSLFPRSTRYLLVVLRGASLLLLACVLAGVKVEYETATPKRILVYRSGVQNWKDDARQRALAEATNRVLASLNAGGFEFIERADLDREEAFTDSARVADASVFVTDGALATADARSEIERASIASGGGTVFVVTDLLESANPRVALESISIMNRPLRGVPLLVSCVVHGIGMRGRATLLTISDDAQVRSSVQVLWSGDDERQVSTLEVVPKVAGWTNYSVRTEAAGGEDPTTHARPLTIFAEEGRQRVLFLEGEPTWEAKFIRRAIEKADLFEVDYFAQVSRAAMVGIKDKQAETDTQTASPKETGGRGSPNSSLRGALSSAARLNAYDCVILGATPDSLLSNVETSRLREWLERRGGGLIILGGNSFAGSIVAPKGKLGSLMPAEVDSGRFRSDSQTLARNTPVEAAKSGGGIMLTPTDAGQRGALWGYSSAVEGKARPGALSGEGLRFGKLRPGTTVLAVSGKAGDQDTGENGAPLIATMRYGAGRVVVFAPADSWRMRTSETDDQTENDGPFTSLWQGMTLWAASTSRPPVEVVISDNSPSAGKQMTAEIHVRNESYAPSTIEQVSGRLQQFSETTGGASPNESAVQELPFRPDPNDASIWRARFTAPPVGRFGLEINYAANGEHGKAEKYFATVTASSIETGASRDTLTRVARETGGDLFAVSALNSLNERLAALPQNNQTVSRTLELRYWWLLALIIPLLLSCEWLIERVRAKDNARA